MLLAPLALLAQLQVEGLRANESWTEIAPGFDPFATTDEQPLWRYRGGRVVDALSNRPIVGAQIEVWTEEIDDYAGGFRRVGAATSGADGGFLIEFLLAGRTAEKARISAPGYSTWSGVAGEIGAEIRLFPMAEPAELRFVDPEGQAIPGVRVTSTYSCSHDLPAVHMVSDAQGIVRLENFGIQDRSPELRILPPDRGAIEYLDSEWIHERRPEEGPATMVLPRRPGAAVRVLERDGSPLAFEPFYIVDGECYHVLTSDEQGRLRVPCRFGPDDVAMRKLEPQSRFYADVEAELAAQYGFERTVRAEAEDWPESLPHGKVEVVDPKLDEDEHGPGYILIHEEGWQARSAEPDENAASQTMRFIVPAGRVRFLAGGTFSAYAAEMIEIEVEEGSSHTLRPQFEKQPVLQVQWPEGSWNRWIEAADSSIAGEDMARDGQPVPRNTPLILHYRFEDQPVLVRHPGIDADTVLVLEPPARQEPLPMATREIIVRHADGSIATKASIRAEGWRYEIEVDGEDDTGSALLLGPAGAEVIGSIWEQRSVLQYFRTRMPQPGESDAPLEVTLERSPRITLEGPEGWRLMNWTHEVVDTEVGQKVLEICPGRADLVIGLADGRQLAVRLDIQPGDERRIRIVAD
ncbi:MAG: hypothetical protein CMJ94_15535 [Planctomycetes bacterium]|nr:hypothetical protein [Planctomycetota bacterium]